MAPVFSLVLDEDVSADIALMYPELYRELMKGRSLSLKTFFTWVLISIYQGIACHAHARAHARTHTRTWLLLRIISPILQLYIDLPAIARARAKGRAYHVIHPAVT